MHWQSLGALAAVWLAGVMLPGPNFAAVSRAAVGLTRQLGIFTALGVSTGAILWAISAMAGLNALFTLFPWLYAGLKVLGGVYLIVVGARMLWAAVNGGAEAPELPGRVGGPWSAWRLGVLTSLSNPKTAAFFGSVFLAVFPAQTEHALQLAALPLIFGISIAWYSLVACCLSTPAARSLYRRMRRWLDGLMGAFFAGVGCKLLASSAE